MHNLLTPDQYTQSGIYIIRNTLNAKVYVGSTLNFSSRYREHKSKLLSGKHHCPPLKAFVGKYGVEVLRFEVLLLCSAGRLLTWEQRCIDFFKASVRSTGFNVAPVAGTSRGTKRTAEQLITIRQAAKLKASDPAYRAKIAVAATGRRHTSETIAKIKEGNKGKSVSAQTRALMSAARTGKKNSPETIAKRVASCKAALERKALLTTLTP